MSWLEIVVPLLCALLGSPLVIHLIQRIRIVRQLQLEGEVERWVKIACSYAELWAANRRKEDPEAKVLSAEKLARARELVRERIPAALDDAEIEARIEHELTAREERRVAVGMEYAGGALRPRVEKVR
jgi:hypothetical protein